MATHSTVWTGVLNSAATTLAVGYAVVPDSSGTFVAATAANRASYGRSAGVAITAASAANTAFEYQVAGVIDTSVTGLGAGSVSWVRASSTGTLERCTPGSGDDLLGKCNARGDLFVAPGTWDSANYAGGGGGGGTPGGSDNQVQYNDGGAFGGNAGLTINEASNRPVMANGAEFTDGANTLVLDGTPTGSRALTLPDATDTLVGRATTDTLTNKSISLTTNTLSGTSAEFRAACSDETGTGALVFNTSPTFLTTTSYGASPSTFGAHRYTNNEFLWWRGGGTNYQVLGLNAIDEIVLGDSADIIIRAGYPTGVVTVEAGELNMSGALRLRSSAGLGNYLTLDVPAIGADYVVAFPLLTGSTDTIVTDAATQTLTSKTVNATDNTITDTSTAAGDILKSNGTKFVRMARGSALHVLRVNAGGTDLEWAAASGSSSFADNVFEVTDNGDATKKLAFECSGITTATTRTLTVPNASTTIVGTDVTQTLTNKTINLSSNTLTFTSAQLATACSDETGTAGNLVFSTNCSLTSPSISSPAITGTATIAGPLIGSSSGHALSGLATQATADANQTLGSSVYSRMSVNFTGANTVQRTMTFPHPASDDQSYWKLLSSDCTGAGGILISTGTGNTIAMANTQKALMRFSPNGVEAIASYTINDAT